MQSEPFDAGFQSVRFLNHRGKVVVGAEDGAVNIFNQGEYGNISDRFPLVNQRRNFGDCSVDSIEVINDTLIAVGCSDCRLRLVQIFPNRVLYATGEYESAVESLHWRPESEQLISTETNVLLLHKVVSREDDDEAMEEPADAQSPGSDDSLDSDESDQDEGGSKRRKKPPVRPKKANTQSGSNFFGDL